MNFRVPRFTVLLAILAGSAAGPGLAQDGTAARDFEAEIEAALRSAKSAAGIEWLGTLNRNCLLPASRSDNTSDELPRYVRDPATIPDRETWYAEPAKVFDNLYFVGGKVHSSWALTTSDGIIIIDTIFPTEFDSGRPVNVAYPGGTAFNFVNSTPDPGIGNFQIYIDSQRHIAGQADRSGASVLLSNHTEFDNAVNRNRMLAGRGDGPHPYEVGPEWVQRYFQVMEGCARAAQIRLERELFEDSNLNE